MNTLVAKEDLSSKNYDVIQGYAYKLTFIVNCSHFKGKIGRLGVCQNGEEIASKETLTIGSNAFIIYPKSTGLITLDFEFSENMESVCVDVINLEKLESVMVLPDNLQSCEVFAAVASIPQRESSLKDVIDNMLPQVDRLFIYLNGYNHIPDFIKNEKIEFVLDPMGRTAAAAKLYWAKQVEGYYFSIDDDIIYPFDYCMRTIELYEQLTAPCIVSYHGKNFSMLATHQRLDRVEFYQFEHAQLNIEKVHVVGTGVAMFDTRKVKIDLYSEAAQHPRSIDLTVSIALRKAGISRYTLPRNEGWLKQSQKVNHGLNEFKQIDKNASKDVEGLMLSGLPWLEGRWKFRLFRAVLGRVFWLIPSTKHKKLKKLLRNPRKFFVDSNIPLFKKIFN